MQGEGNRQLQSTIVWVPVLDGDSCSAAETQADLLRVHGVTHVWDGRNEVGPHFVGSLDLTGPGWDLYLIHGAGVRWEGKFPPPPTFWMHQLSSAVGADPALYLGNNPHLLRLTLHDLLTSSA